MVFSEAVPVALACVYFSICFGIYLKLRQYNIRNFKVSYSLFSPVLLMLLGTFVSWNYIALHKAKASGLFCVADKVLIMFRLFLLNVQIFPALAGFSTVLFLGSGKLDFLYDGKSAYQLFSKKLYELYDGYTDAGC